MVGLVRERVMTNNYMIAWPMTGLDSTNSGATARGAGTLGMIGYTH